MQLINSQLLLPLCIRAAPWASIEAKQSTDPKKISALSLSPCLCVSVVNPLGVIGNRSLPPQDP